MRNVFPFVPLEYILVLDRSFGYLPLMIKYLAFLYSFFFSCSVCLGQRSQSDSVVFLTATQLHYGSILPHSKSITHLTDSYLWGMQADVSRVRYTRDAWNTCNCYSQNGFSISYFNFNNPRVLGSSLSLAVFAEPQLTYGRMSLALRAGAGISYLSRVYNPETNPENLFFSSPWSGLLLLQISARYHLNDNWSLRLNTAYHHISNGGKRQPNKGMNFPTLGAGVDYSLKHFAIPRRAKIPLVDRSLHFYGGLFYNTRSVDESNFESGKRKIVIGLQAGFYKPLARMHALGLGFEASHDSALKTQALQENLTFDHHIVSGLIRHHFLFGRFDFSQALGIYLHKEYRTPEEFFQRYALEYRIWRKVNLGFSLKAHLHTAEQMDVRLGLQF
jgi:hypothetical protein